MSSTKDKNQALLLIKQGDFAGALSQLREAFKANPDDPSILVLIGLCNAKLGAFDAAITAYTKAIANKASAAQQLQAWLGLSSVFSETANDEKHLNALENARALLMETDAGKKKKKKKKKNT